MVDSSGYSEEQAQFADFEHQYLRDYIALADQKAGVTFAVVAAMGAYVIQADGLILNASTSTEWWKFAHYTTLAFFASSALFSALIVYPHLRSSGGSLIYFGDVASSWTPENYATTVQITPRHELTRQKLVHCQVLASICRRKYLRLQWSFSTGCVGLLVWIASR